MLLEPTVIVLYVDNLAISSKFYQDLLGIKVEEASPTFSAFRLSNGMSLALKAKHAVEPPANEKGCQGELAFVLNDRQKVDELFAAWQVKKINMMLAPSMLSYGYTFVALDPDGNRLRVASLEKA